MARPSDFRPTVDDAVAALAGVAAVAGSFAAVGFTPAFVASPLERWLARRMPGIVVSLAIQYLGSLGQQLNLAAAAALAVLTLGACARLGATLGEALSNRAVPPVVGGAAVFALTVLATGSLASGVGAAVGATGTLGVAALSPALPGGDLVRDDRRRVLASLGTAAGVGLVATVLGSGTNRQSGGIPEDASPEVREALTTAADNSLDVPGLEPLVSDQFFNVDINAVDPQVDADAWELTVTGAVEEEVAVDMAALQGMDTRTEFHTLRCVGESRNGEKMDNALWTGVPITDIVDRAGPESGCECVMLRAADGYYEEFPIDALNGGMLAYRMNGRSLPRGHGHPVRALVPGHWGEINVKWITEIEVLEREAKGYWEERGWHGTGPVNAVAKIHAENTPENGRKQVGGHAYAGTRGVSAVEVSVDGGETWNEARLSEPLMETVEWEGDPGQTPHAPDVWRQWAYEYDHPGEAHEVVARVIEGDGTVQPEEASDAYPNGPSGWVSRTVR